MHRPHLRSVAAELGDAIDDDLRGRKSGHEDDALADQVRGRLDDSTRPWVVDVCGPVSGWVIRLVVPTWRCAGRDDRGEPAHRGPDLCVPLELVTVTTRGEAVLPSGAQCQSGRGPERLGDVLGLDAVVSDPQRVVGEDLGGGVVPVVDGEHGQAGRDVVEHLAGRDVPTADEGENEDVPCRVDVGGGSLGDRPAVADSVPLGGTDHRSLWSDPPRCSGSQMSTELQR